MRSRALAIVFLSLSSLTLTGCFRGQRSEKQPIHLFTDMQDQSKYNPYGASPFFADGAAMRPPIEGTVSTEVLNEDRPSLTPQLLTRGQNRYAIFCQSCHGAVGDGKGIVALRGIPRGLVPPTNYHTDQMRGVTDEHIYDVVTNGIRNMSEYGTKMTPQDRWAVVEYVRVLQRSQYAGLADVPEEKRHTLAQGEKR